MTSLNIYLGSSAFVISSRFNEASRFLICFHLLAALNLLDTNSVFTKLDAPWYIFVPTAHDAELKVGRSWFRPIEMPQPFAMGGAFPELQPFSAADEARNSPKGKISEPEAHFSRAEGRRSQRRLPLPSGASRVRGGMTSRGEG